MKVFLDECVDWRLGRDIVGHEIKTARQMGWTSIKNGELLALVSQSFDVFITADKNIAFQQNIAGLTISVIVLQARSNRLADLKGLVPKLLKLIETAKPGSFERAGER